MKEVKHYCDNCGKEVWGDNCATVTIFAGRGAQDRLSKFRHEEFAGIHYKSKEIYHHLLCKSCIASEIEGKSLYQDTFGIADEGIGLLKRIGLWLAPPKK